MKQNKNELDVDFIGGLVPLTKAEEKAISEFIKAEKAKRVLKKKQTKKTQKKPEQNSLPGKHESVTSVPM
ncbi:MAG: hypothetical protein ABIR03_04680 [Ginsengibacter sp.]